MTAVTDLQEMSREEFDRRRSHLQRGTRKAMGGMLELHQEQ
jgi:hypothetical protein